MSKTLKWTNSKVAIIFNLDSRFCVKRARSNPLGLFNFSIFFQKIFSIIRRTKFRTELAIQKNGDTILKSPRVNSEPTALPHSHFWPQLI